MLGCSDENRPASPGYAKIVVLPGEFFYYLGDNATDLPKKGVGKIWDPTPVAILAVSNPTDTSIPRVKVRVNDLDFLVRPPRFELPGRSYRPLLVRLAKGHDEVKMQLVADDDSVKGKDQPLQTRLVLRRVEGPNELRAAIAVSTARRGNVPVFHSNDLTKDQVRVALENTGVKSVAADFINRNIPFSKLCGITWGCCLKGRPRPGSFVFKHPPTCPIIQHRGMVALTEAGQQQPVCPLCGSERSMLTHGQGGLPYELINIIIQFIDPLL